MNYGDRLYCDLCGISGEEANLQSESMGFNFSEVTLCDQCFDRNKSTIWED